MLTTKKIPLLIAGIACIELLVYLWAVWTTTLDKNHFFAIEPAFIFDKCARNSGRVSATLILFILLMLGYYGLKQIYSDNRKKDTFRILISLFTFNHLIHFLFLFLRFKSHGAELTINADKHGFITFICIVISPFILWSNKNLNIPLYLGIILHLFNVSYFMNKTFLSKIKPDQPAYHNQLGIVLLTLACLYVLYRVIRENVQKFPSSSNT